MEEKEKELREAAGRGDEVRVQQLLAEGVNVNAANDAGDTALHLAATSGHTGTVQALLTAGATADARYLSNWTPLHSAAKNGHTGPVQALLAAGADINAQDIPGWTALHSAAGNGHTGTVQALLKAGAMVDERNLISNRTPLHFAAKNGHTGPVQALLAAGADINARDHTKQTPLHYAAKNGHTGPVQALLEAGADINARDNSNRTPLHFAADRGYPECVKILLKTGANTIIRDNLEMTAEGLAAQEDVLKVFQFFKDLQPKVVDDLLTIDLSGRELTSVPAEVFDTRDVERLVLSNNRLTSIPEEIGQLQKLQVLKLDNNLLAQLPQAITTLPDLQYINLSANRFKEIPDVVCSLLQLKSLNVGSNPLKCLPDKVHQLTGLRRLHMDRCQFAEFPRQVLQLEGLVGLRMGKWAEEGRPSPVPEDISRLKNLQVLELQNNDLESLPDGVGELVKLTYLNFAGNRFTSVPEQIMKLSNIRELDLSDNRISRLPLTLSRLAQLKDMDVSGNPLTYPPPDVCEKGTAAIMDYMRREMKKKEEKELKKLFFRFSRNVKEPPEVEDLAGALGIGLSSIQASKDQTPTSQGYNVLLQWMNTEREASMDKLQQELSDFGMDKLAQEAGRTKAQPAKRPADTSGGPPAKRPAAGGSGVGHEEERQSKDAMAQVLQENRRLRALLEELQGSKTSGSREPGDRPVVLLLNDEYGTAKGGISTLHRQLACLLASNGAKVYSTVLSATQEDKDDAGKDKVQLIFPTASKRDKRKPCLDWLTFDHTTRYQDLPSHVDFILGHVPVTSHAARQIKERFPDAKVIQVTHVMPEDTSHYKSEERVLSIGEENDNILDDLRHADVIFSVGPLMYDYYKMQTKQLKPHYEFLPKPSDIFRETEVTYVDAKAKTVLTVGRVQGVERLKGYDLSATAMGEVIDHVPYAKWRGRGVSAEDFPESKAIIEANVKKGKFHFTPLKYGTQRELSRDMQQASVVLMPSRAEPFGLVGLEAIAAGVPVLVSHKSGLAWFLRKDSDFERPIVEIDDDDEEAAKTLTKRIIDVLENGEKEFAAARKLKERLLASRYWDASHSKFLEVFGLK